MREEAERRQDREFQYDLTRLQVNFEYTFTIVIGALAILYGLLSFYKDNPLGYTLTVISIALTICIGLPIILWEKEKKFRIIKKNYKLFTKTET